MKKNELMNGDIVVLRSGNIAVVIVKGKDAYLMFQKSGFEFLDDYYSDDLVCEDFDDAVMQVFRTEGGFGFDAVDEVSPIWERNQNWVRPAVEKCAAAVLKAEDQCDASKDVHMVREDQQAQALNVIAQQFYGNCTYTSIHRENVDSFLKGILDPELFQTAAVEVDRKVVRIPGAEYLAIVYDQIQEDKYVREEYPAMLARQGEHYRQRWGEELPMQVSCVIPQIGFKIHTRCFACRIDENGEFQSLQSEDFTPVIMCFAR